MAIDNLTLGMGVGVFLAALVALCVVGAIFMAIGAAIAQIRDRTFGKAIMATLLVWIIAGVVSSIVGVIHPLAGLVAYVLLAIVFVKATYGCGFLQSVIALVMSVVVSAIATVALVFALGEGSAFTKPAPQPTPEQAPEQAP